MPSDRFEVVVVGGGVVGLAAAERCGRAGRSTLLLERSTFGHRWSSSRGATRLFRVLYATEHAARLARAALPLWRELEERSGIRLLDRSGLLFFGVDGPETREGSLAACERVARSLGLPVKRYEGRNLSIALPALGRIDPGWTGLFDPDAAVIRADDALEALAQSARDRGVVLREESPVTDLRPRPAGGIDVICGDESYRAERLILAPGVFTEELLRLLGTPLDLTLWKMTYAHYRPAAAPEQPVWYYFGPPGERGPVTYYGFPPDPRTGLAKVGADFTFDTARDPRDLDPEPDPRILDRVAGFHARHVGAELPGFRESLAPRVCLYTMTRDFEPVLDFIPERRDAVIFTGGSGGAFKFAPLLGQALFELACEGESRVDLRPWSATRSAVRVS